MNDKEAREIRRRFKPDKTWINAVHGCYVNESKKVISTFRESVQTMVQDESERFLALLKKPITGTIGRNLINLEFSARQVMESEEHKLLMAMRACGLENEELLAAFYNRVAQTLNIDGGYIILLVHDTTPSLTEAATAMRSTMLRTRNSATSFAAYAPLSRPSPY